MGTRAKTAGLPNVGCAYPEAAPDTQSSLELIASPTPDEENSPCMGRKHTQYRRYILGQFIRQVFHSKSLAWPLTDSRLKREINAQAALWSATWQTMERLETTYGVYIPFGAFQSVFAGMATQEEGQMLVPHYVTRETSKGSLKKIFVYPSENLADLNTAAAVFAEGSLSWQIMQPIVYYASRQDAFKRDYYLPMIQAREAVFVSTRDHL